MVHFTIRYILLYRQQIENTEMLKMNGERNETKTIFQTVGTNKHNSNNSKNTIQCSFPIFSSARSKYGVQSN